MTAAVFLDRDNTIIHNDGDLGDPAQVRLIQGAASAIASLKGLGYRIIVVTNQGGVARGKYTEADVDRVNERINDLMKANSGVFVDRFYYCPYHPEGTIDRYRRDHPWRKPRPGMLLQAARDLGLDLRQSWMIGDQMRDVQAGFSAGVVPILLAIDGTTPPATMALPPVTPGSDDRSGTGPKPVPIEPARDYFVVRSLIEAVRLVGQKSRPTNVTAAMKTERIEVIPRPQPRVATASFDASSVPIVGQEPTPDPGAQATQTATIEAVKPVAFAELARDAVAVEEVRDVKTEPAATRKKRPRTPEETAKTPSRTTEGEESGRKKPGVRDVIEIEAKAEPKSESRGEVKVESKPRPPIEARPVEIGPVVETARGEPLRSDVAAMPTVTSLPTAEMKPARVPPSKRREEEHPEPRPAAIEAETALRSADAPDVAAAMAPPATTTPKPAPSESANPQAAPPAEQTLRQILQELRSQRKVAGEFNTITIMAIVLQMVAVVCLMGALLMGAGNNDLFMRWGACAIVLQLATLAMLMFRK